MRTTIQRLRDTQDANANAARGMIRRLLLTGQDGALATVAGDEDADGNVESDQLEVFGVAGVRSHPGPRGEAIVVRVGGRGHEVIVATRDRGMGAGGELEPDEIVIETSQRVVKITANGEILIGSLGGIFERVATESHAHGPGTLTNGGGLVTGLSGPAVVNGGPASGTPDLIGRGLARDVSAETEVG